MDGLCGDAASSMRSSASRVNGQRNKYPQSARAKCLQILLLAHPSREKRSRRRSAQNQRAKFLVRESSIFFLRYNTSLVSVAPLLPIADSAPEEDQHRAAAALKNEEVEDAQASETIEQLFKPPKKRKHEKDRSEKKESKKVQTEAPNTWNTSNASF